MLYFLDQPGTVKAIPLPNQTVMPIFLTGWNAASAFGMSAIITEASIAQRVSYQAQPSLDSRLFLAAFGDEPSQLRIGGLAFAANCSNTLSGVEAVLAFYAANKFSAKKAPVTVTLGGSKTSTSSAFLVGCSFMVSRPEDGVGQFAFEFLGVSPT